MWRRYDDTRVGSRALSHKREFITGQLGRAGRLFVPRECTIFQALSEASISDRLDRSQLKSDGGTRGQ